MSDAMMPNMRLRNAALKVKKLLETFDGSTRNPETGDYFPLSSLYTEYDELCEALQTNRTQVIEIIELPKVIWASSDGGWSEDDHQGWPSGSNRKYIAADLFSEMREALEFGQRWLEAQCEDEHINGLGNEWLNKITALLAKTAPTKDKK